MDPVFDTQALRQAAEMPWPTEFREQSRLWAQNASDLAAAADYIEEIEARLAHLESEWKLGSDRGDHVVYRDEWEAFDKWQRTVAGEDTT